MEITAAFLFAFAFSFLGSIPPGTLNLTALHLGLEKKLNVAWRFAIAAALVEYPYAWIAVKFSRLILHSTSITNNLHLITAVVMITLGLINIIAARRPTDFSKRYSHSGFRKGIVLGILNPLAIPYWVAITAYLESHNWITIDNSITLHGYLLGVSLGAGSLLILLAYLTKHISKSIQHKNIKMVPGIILIILGLYALFELMM